MSNWFEVSQVAEHVYAISEPYHYEEVVSYLLLGEKRAFLIDTGMGYRSIKKVTDLLTDLPITVLLTHSHWDHIGSVHQFKDVCIFDHSFETEAVAKGFNSAEIAELNDANCFSQGFSSQIFLSPGKKQLTVFADQAVFADKAFTVEVLHTPGHTPGSVCFYVKELEYLFTGDTLYAGPEFLYLDGSSFEAYAKSVEKLALISDRCENLTLFPGHNTCKESSKLLYQHHAACQKKLTPQGVKSGTDTYGTYKEYQYERFSLRLGVDEAVVFSSVLQSSVNRKEENNVKKRK